MMQGGAVGTLVAFLLGCNSDPEYRAGRSISLIGLFDRARVEAAPREPAQLAQVTYGGAERVAIMAHAPSTIRFPAVHIAPDARLSFGIGLEDRRIQAYSDGVGYSVRIRGDDGTEQEVWTGAIDTEDLERRRWLDVEVDLGRWAGRTVDIVLETTPHQSQTGDWAAWSNPVIRSGGGPADAALPPVVRHRVVRDLLVDSAPLEPSEPGGAACLRRVRFVVPQRASLDIAAQILRDSQGPPGPLGPIRLELTVDGQPLVQRDWVTHGDSIITFSETVSLEPFAGQTVDLGVELCDRGLGNTLTWSTRLWLTSAETRPRQRVGDGPNLLFVVVDTLRADHLGTYGYSRPTSPELDRLAGESLVFDKAISGSSWTQPAVASLLTGRSPIEHGVIEGVPLPARYEVLAERMQAAGLSTFGFSANPIVGRLEAMHRGFETFSQVPWSRAGEVNQVFGDWLEDKAGLRWFAYLQYIDPHSPYDAPGEDGARFTAGCQSAFLHPARLDRLSNFVNFGGERVDYTDADIDCLLAHYDGEIRYWDTAFGELLNDMRRRGVLDDTIIVVTSDHGEEFMEHGRILHGYQLFDESIRVPLIVWAPGLVSAGRRLGPVETRDVYSTILDLLDLPPDPDGPESLLDRGMDLGQKTYSHTTEAYVPQLGYTVLAAVRDGRFKYVLSPHDQRHALYDLQADPGEQVDRAGDDPEARGAYGGALEAWLAGAPADSQQIRGIDPGTLEKLRALGYIR